MRNSGARMGGVISDVCRGRGVRSVQEAPLCLASAATSCLYSAEFSNFLNSLSFIFSFQVGLACGASDSISSKMYLFVNVFDRQSYQERGRASR